MGRKKDDKTRQEKQKEIFDNLLYDDSNKMKGFYDYVIDGLEEIDQMKKTSDRVFSKVMKKKIDGIFQWKSDTESERPKVEDYIQYIALQLTEHTPALIRWTNGGPWGFPTKELEDGTSVLEQQKIYSIWLKTVKQWWEEDSFPLINEGRGGGTKLFDLNYVKRDVTLFFLMVFQFTVEESDEFLINLTLVKDSEHVRPLYTLDYKESLFRWVLLWNENHEQVISYEMACEYYYEYGAWLLDNIRSSVQHLFQEIHANHLYLQDVFPYKEENNKEYAKEPDVKRKKQLYEQDFEKHLMEMIPPSAELLFEQKHAENLKRLMALTAHAERKLKRMLTENSNEMEHSAQYERIFEFKKYNDHTRLNRGTEFAWSKLARLADRRQKDFEKCFDAFKTYSQEFIGEAYWSQYSRLNRLAIRSEAFEGNIQLVKNYIKKDADQFYYQRLKEVFDNANGKNISFAYDGGEIQEILKKFTNTRGIISTLQKPIRVADAVSCVQPIENSAAGISQLMNSYHNWCTGKGASDKSPHAEFIRERVLKVALASGAETVLELQYALHLSGNANFQLLNPKEAMIYLITSYHENINELWSEIKRYAEKLVNKRFGSSDRDEVWKDLKKKVAKLPKELGIELPEKVEREMDKKDIPAYERPSLVKCLNEWVFECDYNTPELAESLINRIRKADFISALYYTGIKENKKNELCQKMFYGPYLNDFKTKSLKKKKAEDGEMSATRVEDQIAWLQVVTKLYEAMKQIFTKEGVSALFSFAYSIPDGAAIDENLYFTEKEMTDIIKNRMKTKIHRKKGNYNLAEPYCALIEEELCDRLENMEMEDVIHASENEIRKCLNDFGEVVKRSEFLYLTIPAIETRYILEQWASVLAVLEYYDMDMSDEQQLLNEVINVWEQGHRLIQAEKTLQEVIDMLFTERAGKWLREYEIPTAVQLYKVGLWGNEKGEDRYRDFAEGYCELISKDLLPDLEYWKKTINMNANDEEIEVPEWHGVLKKDENLDKILEELVKAMSICHLERQKKYSKRVQELLETWVCLTVVLEHYQIYFDANQRMLGQKLLDWLEKMDRIA